MKMSVEELNEICMEMIANAGEGRAKVYEALESYHKKNGTVLLPAWMRPRNIWRRRIRFSLNG